MKNLAHSKKTSTFATQKRQRALKFCRLDACNDAVRLPRGRTDRVISRRQPDTGGWTTLRTPIPMAGMSSTKYSRRAIATPRCPLGHQQWCHSSVGRAKDWKSLCPRFDSWWHHRRPLILNELAAFLSPIPLQVATLVTTPTIIYWIIVFYACCGIHISIVLILQYADY